MAKRHRDHELKRRLDATVLAVLARESPAHVVDIAASLDEHPVTVDQACARLHDRGAIRPANHGVYTLTEQGTRRCDEEPP